MSSVELSHKRRGDTVVVDRGFSFALLLLGPLAYLIQGNFRMFVGALVGFPLAASLFNFLISLLAGAHPVWLGVVPVMLLMGAYGNAAAERDFRSRGYVSVGEEKASNVAVSG